MSPPVTSAPGVRFALDDVVAAVEPLPSAVLKQALERSLDSPILTGSTLSRPVVQGVHFHPLIAAAALAYKQHYPLALSPDIIWVTILQGVAQHINHNAGALRQRLVHHRTRIELGVETDLGQIPRIEGEMGPLVDTFAAKIAHHIRPEKRFLLETRFSTTGDVERIVQG